MAEKVDNIAVGRRIKDIRVSRGETSAEFAEHFEPKASKGTVSKWENGHYLPNNKRIKRIAELGNITVEELLYGGTSEYITGVLRGEYADELNLEYVKDMIKFYQIAGSEFSYSKDNLINHYQMLVRSNEENYNHVEYDSVRFPLGSFTEADLIELLNIELLDIENEITIIENYIDNNELDKDEYLENHSIASQFHHYAHHLEEVRKNVAIPTQDFYIYKGVIYFTVDMDKISIDSIKFDSSRYDLLTVYDPYNQIVEISDEINNELLLDIIKKYKFTTDDWYKIELSKLPTKWFVVNYETIKDPDEIQIISEKVISKNIENTEE